MSSGEAEQHAGGAGPVDPALFWRADVRRMLAALDIGALYRVLGTDAGVSQRQIAARTGQSQSEVSEIVAGRRRVGSHQVLVRIAEGFDIPRELMGLSWWGPGGAYCGEVEVPESAESPEEVGEDVRRRALIATTSLTALGQVVKGMGELAELALPTGQPLPSRVGMAHVRTVQAVTVRLRDTARQFGGQAGLFQAAAQHYLRWLEVPGAEVVKAKLGAALAELCTEAGWACYDSGIDGTGYFTRAQRVADTVGDGVGIANAAWHAGATLLRSGYPDDALKCFQLGQFVLTGFQPGKATPATVHADDPRIPTLTARLNRQSATAYALIGDAEQAQRRLAEAHEGWTPRDAYDRGAMDSATAGVQLNLCRLDAAQQFAMSAVRAFGDGFGRERMRAELLLAEVYVRAEDSRGLVLAQQAIEAVSALQSVAVRQERLVPLAAALETRPGGDARELARAARQIAATPM